ncbi:(Fe-S)-binding protein [Panacibacter ginsenosidivorans]|uniref:(Fe-S)-binding protein n=1 Tax=Panacibacter ginsenosidivorans TaxID=1813871 RepID=A0A5B8VEG1_9BACT|nr:(Fe-S)-binding protein [Panacibacter ginsenosidivorans]QEC69659.1 (Fe-S)-binding protein [Panacibacter ginsenosidivorans]
MEIIFQIAFIAFAAVAIWLFSKKLGELKRNILLGRDETINDNTAQRWRNVLLLAFGQKKMFKNPLVAVMHFVIYAGFIIINLEVLEIILDGILGTHRLFTSVLPLGLYNFLINAFEFLAVGVFTVCVIFLIRRNILKLKRFISKDLNGWPRSDANYILITEIILMTLFLTMNACDTLLQQRGYSHYGEHITGNFSFSTFLHPFLNGMNDGTIADIERTCWWLHIIGIFAFLNYLPYSKHLHILFAFPNAYYARLQPQGKMENMPDIQKEVLYAMQPELIPADAAEHKNKFGAKDIFDLSWKNLLDAYSCTECGRCTAACPANITGKKLSPRLIMMKTRDRAEEVGRNINANKSFVDDGKSLLHNYITEEELRACTTCNACVEACPVSINPLDIILQQRRYLIMEESNAPQEWNGTFSNIENNFAPWKFSPDDRDKWVGEMQ